MTSDIHVRNGVVLAVAVIALTISSVALGAVVVGRSTPGGNGMMGGNYGGMMGGSSNGNYGGMMGGSSNGSYGGMMGGQSESANSSVAPQPGTAGFVPGTSASPRVIRVLAGPGYTFSPSTITVARGETVTFVATTMGPLVHEFMVGPADAVAADLSGTPEVADIGMMESKSLTYTFDGSGPYAYACHAKGHYEAGMRGIITVVG
jgi:plastocyanin